MLIAPMLNTFNALFPVFMVIVTGTALRMSGLIEAEQWRGIERLTYYVFFPALLIMTMAMADLSALPVASIGGALMGSVLIMAMLLLAARPLLARLDIAQGPAFSSVFQGASRWNSFIAISVAGALFGAQGVAITAIAIAAMVPLLNILAVYVLSRFAKGGSLSLTHQVRQLVANPFIWSTSIGMVLAALNVPLPKVVISYGDIVGRAALVMGLLMVGAGLDLSALMRPRMATWIACCAKLVLMPVLVFSLCTVLGVTGIQLAVTMLCSAVPTAPASYLLAKQNGGDHELMAEIITMQTLFAILTLPVVLSLVQ